MISCLVPPICQLRQQQVHRPRLICRGSDGQVLHADANDPDNQMRAVGSRIVAPPVQDILDAAFIAVRSEALAQI